MGTVNHRLPLIHPSALDVGMAQLRQSASASSTSGCGATALDVELAIGLPAGRGD